MIDLNNDSGHITIYVRCRITNYTNMTRFKKILLCMIGNASHTDAHRKLFETCITWDESMFACDLFVIV